MSAPPKQYRVPAALLLAKTLSASEKILWIALQFRSKPHLPVAELAMRSGLGVSTVRVSLPQVTGFRPGTPRGPSVLIPADLLQDPQLKAQPKLMYGSLQLVPQFERPAGRTAVTELASLTGISAHTVRSALRSLREHGWLQVAQAGKFSPIHFTLCNPMADLRSRSVQAARRRLDAAPFTGEALMREYLTLLVESDEYEDDASPGFLINPFTGEEMQLDRYYPPGVAYEFNGPQHYGPTARYPSEEEALKQQVRDFLKERICARRGIRLVIVRPEDLSLDGMVEKVRGLLPLRSLEGHEDLVAFLESRSLPYRRKALEESPE